MKTKTIFIIAILSITILGCRKKETNTPSSPPTPIVVPTSEKVLTVVAISGKYDLEYISFSSDGGSSWNTAKEPQFSLSHSCFSAHQNGNYGLSYDKDKVYKIKFEARLSGSSANPSIQGQRTFKLVLDTNNKLVFQVIPDASDLGSVNLGICQADGTGLTISFN